MKQNLNCQKESIGLLANGSSGHWDVAINESLDRDAWFLEIEGPRTYLICEITSLGVLSEVAQFLDQDKHSSNGQRKAITQEFVLGRFGSAVVSLLWDCEGAPRCIILIAGEDVCACRLCLEQPDVKMWADALRMACGQISTTSIARPANVSVQ